MSAKEFDHLATYCPQLGGEIPFSYCRVAAEGSLCRRIVLCWEFLFDIGRYLQENYQPDEIRKALAPPVYNRLQTIMNCVAQAGSIKKDGP